MPHSNHTPTRCFSAMKTTPDHPRKYRPRPGAVDGDGPDLTYPETEEPVLAGTKRSRDGDDLQERSAHTLEHQGQSQDHIAAIILRAKRLRLSDSTVEDRDREVLHMRTKPLKRGETPMYYGAAPLASRLSESVQPSLSGLPEELVIDIVLDLPLFDILALRGTNRRMSSITRARIIWITHLSFLLNQIHLPKSPATFLPSLFSSSALERIVLRPHTFDQKWFHTLNNHQNPASSQYVSSGWSAPQDIRIPILLPGGRWLIACCDDKRSFNNSVCLWDLNHGKLKWLPEVQVEAEGKIMSMDVKMDRSGSFALMTILSYKINFALFLVHRVDVYRIVLLEKDGAFGFHHFDTLSLNERKASEVQIFPHHGHVLVDLFDRVLIWYYSPMNKCAWIVTSKSRHLQRRFTHRAAHAITRTHTSILVADGDENALRAFHIPPLLNRPAQLSTLLLYIPEPYLEQHLPSFSISLRFSTDRAVDISLAKMTQPSVQNTSQVSGQSTMPDQDRGALFIDATSCTSYLLCAYPLHDISPITGSTDGLAWTLLDRADAHRQTRHEGTESDSGVSSINIQGIFMPFFVPTQPSPRIDKGGAGHALWFGTLGEFSSSLTGDNSACGPVARNVVLMRSLDDPGGLTILSALVPPLVDIGLGQSRMTEVGQGRARKVLWQPTSDSAERKLVRVEEATVDQFSGRVCIVETTTTHDLMGCRTEYRCALRLLEYA